MPNLNLKMTQQHEKASYFRGKWYVEGSVPFSIIGHFN
jgi:hypothetical protein